MAPLHCNFVGYSFLHLFLFLSIGIVKDIMLVVLSVVVFGSPVTPLQYAGYGVALLGLNLHKEYKKSPEKIHGTMESKMK